LKILVASTFSSATDAGGGRAVANLARALRTQAHSVEELSLPFDPDPEWIIEQMLAISLTDVSNAGELLIALRAPAHLLPHPNKVVWFQRHEVEVSDRILRKSVNSADRAALGQARRVFSTSTDAAEHLRRDLGIDTEVLHRPLQPGAVWDDAVARLLG